MDQPQTRKTRFNRTYYEYNSSPFQGPSTEIVDTVVKPTLESYDDIIRDIEDGVQ